MVSPRTAATLLHTGTLSVLSPRPNAAHCPQPRSPWDPVTELSPHEALVAYYPWRHLAMLT